MNPGDTYTDKDGLLTIDSVSMGRVAYSQVQVRTTYDRATGQSQTTTRTYRYEAGLDVATKWVEKGFWKANAPAAISGEK